MECTLKTAKLTKCKVMNYSEIYLSIVGYNVISNSCISYRLMLVMEVRLRFSTSVVSYYDIIRFVNSSNQEEY